MKKKLQLILIFKPPGIERNETDNIDGVSWYYMNEHIKLFTTHHLASKSLKLHEEQFWANEHENKPKENLYLVITLSLTLKKTI